MILLEVGVRIQADGGRVVQENPCVALLRRAMPSRTRDLGLHMTVFVGVMKLSGGLWGERIVDFLTNMVQLDFMADGNRHLFDTNYLFYIYFKV